MKTNETSKKKRNEATDRSLLAALLSNWKRELGYLSVLAASALASQAQDKAGDEAMLPEALPAGRIAISPDARAIGFNKPAWLRRQTTYQPRGFDLVSAFTGTDDCPGRTIPSG